MGVVNEVVHGSHVGRHLTVLVKLEFKLIELFLEQLGHLLQFFNGGHKTRRGLGCEGV